MKFWRAKPAALPVLFTLEPGVRVYAIGDIHGEADLLRELHAKIARDLTLRPCPYPVVVHLGDYVDRGPRSGEVIDILSSPLDVPADVVCLKGNHEDFLLRFLHEGADVPEWRRVGGTETLSSYGIDVAAFRMGRGLREASAALAGAMPERHKRFLQDLVLSWSCGGFFFCHAGIRPGVALASQDPQDLMWIRDEFLASTADFGARIVHGHTPSERPEMCVNRINIDTGAFATGILTCAVIEGASVRLLAARRGQATFTWSDPA